MDGWTGHNSYAVNWNIHMYCTGQASGTSTNLPACIEWSVTQKHQLIGDAQDTPPYHQVLTVCHLSTPACLTPKLITSLQPRQKMVGTPSGLYTAHGQALFQHSTPHPQTESGSCQNSIFSSNGSSPDNEPITTCTPLSSLGWMTRIQSLLAEKKNTDVSYVDIKMH